jgi:hypothetical protein
MVATTRFPFVAFKMRAYDPFSVLLWAQAYYQPQS